MKTEYRHKGADWSWRLCAYSLRLLPECVHELTHRCTPHKQGTRCDRQMTVRGLTTRARDGQAMCKKNCTTHRRARVCSTDVTKRQARDDQRRISISTPKGQHLPLKHWPSARLEENAWFFLAASTSALVFSIWNGPTPARLARADREPASTKCPVQAWPTCRKIQYCPAKHGRQSRAL